MHNKKIEKVYEPGRVKNQEVKHHDAGKFLRSLIFIYDVVIWVFIIFVKRCL